MMEKMKAILDTIERNKSKISKIFIFCATLKFFISTIYKTYDNGDSRVVESLVNIYLLVLIGLVFIHEFLGCILPQTFLENFKMITHNAGKGILFILISILYMPPSLGNQQNYSAYLFFFSGVILILLDIKIYCEETKSPYEMALEVSKTAKMRNSTKVTNVIVPTTQEHKTVGIEQSQNVKVKKANPYDIPDDF